MRIVRTSVVIGVVAALSSCGGSSVSSNESFPTSSSGGWSSVAPTSVADGSGSSVDTSSPPVTIEVDPENLLIDASLDIAAIDGPVVLWFWAPG